MSFSFFKKSESREFPYKPRYYNPNGEKSTDDHRRDFANELHREWSSRRKHTREKKQTPWLTILFMIFFVVILAIVFFKFFSKS